jgi:hypothetical protein
MRLKRVLASASFLVLLSASLVAVPASATSPAWSNLHVERAGTTSLKPAPLSTEIRPDADTFQAATTAPGRRVGINRRLPETPSTSSASGPVVAGSTPVAATSVLAGWEGLNHYDTRFGSSAGVDQYSTEPPDQGLCVGNGYVFESVNSVLAVYSTGGALLDGPTAINEFYGYRVAYNRTTGIPGPDVFDPTCYYDAATNRFFQVAVTLLVDAAGNFTGATRIELAVTATGNPTGSWNRYHIDFAASEDVFPDYPHVGADANGFYITINNYPFSTNGYNGVDIYAWSKSQLAAGNSTVNVSTTFIPESQNAFTVWPAQSPGTASFATANGGTEYLLSSDAVFNNSGSSSQVLLWALTKTNSLNNNPALVLHKATVPVSSYSVPDPAVQKAGNAPLRDCLNDTSLIIQGLGSGCWRFFFAAQQQPSHNEVLADLDSNDTRMQQVSYADGKVWGALDTAVSGPNRAGIAWYAITPSLTGAAGLQGQLTAHGIVAASDGDNVIYPALAVTAAGKGVMGFTLVGPSYFPSAAYVAVSTSGTGAIQVASPGLDSQDGFTGYKAFGNPPRPRWGDYGAAAVDGANIWIASEYIAASCTYPEWLATNFLCDGNTRTALANWSTRITKVAP